MIGLSFFIISLISFGSIGAIISAILLIISLSLVRSLPLDDNNKETFTTSEIPKFENNQVSTNDAPEEPPEKTPAEKVE